MNATNHFLDLLADHERKAGRRHADYALRKILGCSAPVIYHYRSGKRHLSEGHCLIVARALGVDPLQVFAAVNAERCAKDSELREFWTTTAKRAGSAAALALLVTMAQLGPRLSEAAQGSVSAGSHVIYNARNSRRRHARGSHARLAH